MSRQPWDRGTAQALPSSEVTHLHLLRHGRVDTGGRRLAYGHADYPLSPEGRAQGEALVGLVEREIQGADGVISSDLSRCTEVARPLAERLGLPLLVTPALREQAMGSWEGRSWEDLTAEDVSGVRAFWSDYARARPPGGENLEDLERRVDAFFEERWADLRGRRWLVVAHVGVIRVILTRQLGLPVGEALRFTPLPGTHTWLLLAEAGAVLQVLGERPRPMDAGAAGEPRRASVIAPRGARPRVALSGSAGTGKTTLAMALAQHLDLPYIPEGMRRRIEGGLDLHALDHGGLRRLVLALWEEQVEAEEACLRDHGGFVSDRSPLDYAAFWLLYRFTDDTTATERLFEAVAERLDRLDRVVLLPWGVLPLQADGVRSTNPWVQRHFQALVEGLLQRQLDPRRLASLPDLQSLDHRLAWVIDHLEEAGTRG